MTEDPQSRDRAPAGATVHPVTARPPLAITRRGALAVVSLDRPAAFNRITLEMRRALLQAYPGFARDPDCYAVAIRAAPASGRDGRVFCAGSDDEDPDVFARQDAALADVVAPTEHRLAWLIECFSKPTVSLIDGLVAGTGVTITAHGTHRVAGASYGWELPHVRHGRVPDGGIARILARMSDHIGTYLALTGTRIGAADALWLGLATHHIEETHYAGIEAWLAEAKPVDHLLDGLHRDPGPAPLASLGPLIARCFGQRTLEAIIAQLQGVAEAGGHESHFANAALEAIASASPLALKITLRHLREAASLDLRQVMIRDCRIARRLRDSRAHTQASDTGRPVAPRLSDISDQMVERYLVADAATDLHLETRSEMQAARV